MRELRRRRILNRCNRIISAALVCYCRILLQPAGPVSNYCPLSFLTDDGRTQSISVIAQIVAVVE